MIERRFQLPATDGVWCVKFTCTHERILSRSDYVKLIPAGSLAECVECERQAKETP